MVKPGPRKNPITPTPEHMPDYKPDFNMAYLQTMIVRTKSDRAKYWYNKALIHETDADRWDRLGNLQVEGSATPERGRTRQKGGQLVARDLRRARDKAIKHAEATVQAEANGARMR